MSTQPTVLVIAGSDSSGGAGLTRDVVTLTSMNVDVSCVVTAVTAQTNQRVSAVQYVTPAMVRQQIRDGFAAEDIGAVKIGMLGTVDIVQVVADELRLHPRVPIVLDPVILSSSGGVLLEADGIQLMMNILMPLASVLTPNLPELHRLTMTLAESADVISRARFLLSSGAQAVLVKGGHVDAAQARDVLITTEAEQWFVEPRLSVQRRGTGCTLASAIAASLARGATLSIACAHAKRVVTNYLRTAD